MVNICTFSSAILSLEIGCYLWLMELIADLKNGIRSINKTVKLRRNPWQMFKKLTNSIQLHSHLKQLSEIGLIFLQLKGQDS